MKYGLKTDIARRIALANVRLSKLPISDVLQDVLNRHKAGELDTSQALASLGIRRCFKFSIFVQMPQENAVMLSARDEDVLGPICLIQSEHDGLQLVEMQFQREAIRIDDAIETALLDINAQFNNAKILEIR